MQKRSSVLARAGRGSVRNTGSPKRRGSGSGSGGAFSLTEVLVPDSPRGDSNQQQSGRGQATSAASGGGAGVAAVTAGGGLSTQPEDRHHGGGAAADEHSVAEGLEGEKLVLRGDPVAPLSQFRFDPAAPTPLPATVKTETVIAKVQASVAAVGGIPPEALPAWGTFFSSAENRRLVEDLFWYRYLTDHQAGLDEEATRFMAAKTFYRMSASFVHLFRRTPKRHLDAILRVYPGALSQAVYLAFFVACPHECLAFDGRWKTKLERDVCGWCTGMPGRASTFQSWAVSHFDVTPVDRYPAHVLTRVEKQLQREGVATSRHLQANRQKNKRRHSNAAAAAAAAGGSGGGGSGGGGGGAGGAGGGDGGRHDTLQLGSKTLKRRPTLPLSRPIRFKEEVVLTNSGFVQHYQEFGKNPRGIPPYSYQHVANFTRHRSPRRLAAGLDAMWKMSSDDADSETAATAEGGGAPGDGGGGDGDGGAGGAGAGGGSSGSGNAGAATAQPRTYRALIEARANEAWDIIKGYKDSKDAMQAELEREERELAQREAMRAMEEHAIYKSGVHEYSNYLVKQNKSWRTSTVDRPNGGSGGR